MTENNFPVEFQEIKYLCAVLITAQFFLMFSKQKRHRCDNDAFLIAG